MSKIRVSPETILQEMFHADYFNLEQEKICPVCENVFQYHEALVNHIKSRHKKQLVKYTSDLDNMLRDPMAYFTFIWKCVFCGAELFSKSQTNEHMRVEHSEDFKRFKEKFGGKNE